MRTLIVCIAVAGALGAQSARLDAAFFEGDRKVVLRELADRLRVAKADDASVLAEVGRAYLAVLEGEKGRAALQAAEARGPKDGEVLRLVAHAWLRNGHKAEALQAYEQVLRRAPKDEDALADCAVDLAEAGLLAEAERYMQAVRALEPDGWRHFLRFGRACLVAGQRKAAAAWFGRVMDLKPGEEKVQLEILRAYTDLQSLI